MAININTTIMRALTASTNQEAERILLASIRTVSERAMMLCALHDKEHIAVAKDSELGRKLQTASTFSQSALKESMANHCTLSRLRVLSRCLFRDIDLYDEPLVEFEKLSDIPDQLLSLLLVPFAPLWKNGTGNLLVLRSVLSEEGLEGAQKFIASANRTAWNAQEGQNTLFDEMQTLHFSDISEFCSIFLYEAVQTLETDTVLPQISESLECRCGFDLPVSQLYLDDFAFGFLWCENGALLHELMRYKSFDERAAFVRSVAQQAYCDCDGPFAPVVKEIYPATYLLSTALDDFVLHFRHDARMRALWHRHVTAPLYDSDNAD